ncbi:unnamed protein product [Rhizoctonia solani]|uniref:Rho1 guanine nucleotide exchange factor 1 [Schizosaccharomyces pombe 972h-] n=1 Tax=Rhizoctonia solani TaxID=456999 RepID=A0A8H3HLV6_9AGAM|nr:unnamed protein product [Rhizoctonia solani]
MATRPVEEKDANSQSEAKTLDLLELDDLLLFEDGDIHDLKLKDPRRRLIHQGSLKYKSARKEYRVFLLDHVWMVTKPKVVGGRERLRMIDHPIPVQLLQVSSEPTRQTIFGCVPLGKPCYRLCFSSRGKRFNKGKALTFLCPTAEEAKIWTEAVNAQRDANRQSTDSNVLKLGQDMLKGNGEIKVNCAALYDNDQIIAYGTADGVYFQPQNGRPRKAIDLTDVRHIEVLEDLSLLAVQAERSVFTFPLDALDQFDRMNRMSRIANGQASFFKAGTCMGRTMVCIVKATSSSSNVKALERSEPLPESNLLVNRKLKTSLRDKATKLKVFKEFRLPTELYSIQFLKTKLCAAGATGFEVIDLETLDTQVLLDPADNALSFVRQYKHPRPLCVYGVRNEFLVCYREFAFFVNKSGWKSDKDVVIHWEGTPTACALHYPYIAAFSPNFVEIRHLDDGSLVQVIHENNVQCLYTESSPLRTSIGDPASQAPSSSNNSTLVSCANKAMFLTSSSR